MTKEYFLKELTSLYQEALADKNISLAIKIHELRGKAMGFFTKNESFEDKGHPALHELREWVLDMESRISKI